MNCQVTDRFFEAFDELKALGRTNRSRLCGELGVDRRNFAKQEADLPASETADAIEAK